MLTMESTYNQTLEIIESIGDDLFNFRTIAVIAITIIVTVILVKALSLINAKLLKALLSHSENVNDSEKHLNIRRTETWMNIVLAIAQILIITFAIYIVWRLLSPTNTPIAVIGASAFFFVLAGGTISPLLRDYTVGSLMILEKWYGVGDVVKIEPFADVQGVVEKLTLRSTKIRSLGGEVTWVHNQNITAVKVKYHATSNIAIDVFVNDKEKALKLLKGILDIIPKGPLLVIDGLEITDIEELNERIWRIELSGKTIPGREWLIDKFAVEAIKEADAQDKDSDKIIIYGPITRYIDQAAEKRFKRALK